MQNTNYEPTPILRFFTGIHAKPFMRPLVILSYLSDLNLKNTQDRQNIETSNMSKCK